MKKWFWPFFFSYNRAIEYDKSQRTLCKSPRGSLTITAEVIRSNFKESKKLLKTNFWKKAIFLVKKRFWPFFSYNRVIECDKSQRTLCKSPRGNLTFTAEVTRSNFEKISEVVENKFLKKKANFPVKKRFWPFFSYNRVGQTSRDIL